MASRKYAAGYRIRDGKIVECPHKKENPDDKICMSCRFYNEGRCRDCTGPLDVPGRVRCSKCLAKSRRIAARIRKRRRNKGLCVRCGKRPPIPGMNYCDECRSEKHPDTAAYRNERSSLISLRNL